MSGRPHPHVVAVVALYWTIVCEMGYTISNTEIVQYRATVRVVNPPTIYKIADSRILAVLTGPNTTFPCPLRYRVIRSLTLERGADPCLTQSTR